MPKMNAKVAWALPVKADVLGAHLQAYIETLPTVNMLRLANRFGKGPKAAITRLPIELVQRIADFVIADKRSQAAERWKKLLACCEKSCEPADHFSEDEMREECQEACMCGECLSEDGYSDFECECDMSPKALRHFINESASDYIYEIVFERCHMASSDWDDKRKLFSQEATLLRAHFGLELWTSAVRTENQPRDYMPSETTIAYFTLPGAARRRRECELSDFEQDNGVLQSECGYGMPIELNGVPSEHSLRRFPRALQILKLEVFEHPSQSNQTLAPFPTQEASEETANVGSQSWPKLTLLLQTHVEPH